MSKKTRTDCIEPDRVPCDKAKDYLARKGLLCPAKGHPVHKPKPEKSWFEKWFG